MKLFTVLAALTQVAACSTTPQGSNRGVVTYTNTNRFLFDVDGNQIDAYATKIYSKCHFG